MPRLFFFLLLAPPLFAQLSSGTLTGLVSDPQDARVPGVILKLTNEDTGLVNAATSNEQGEYTFSLLPSGRYKITAEKPGFSTLNRTGITVELGRVVRVDLTITVGQVSESVQVTGAAPLLDPSAPTHAPLAPQRQRPAAAPFPQPLATGSPGKSKSPLPPPSSRCQARSGTKLLPRAYRSSIQLSASGYLPIILQQRTPPPYEIMPS
jgi:hypothetical protein